MKMPKKSVPHHIHAAGVILNRGRVLLARRPSKGLLGGMWEFPNGRVDGDPFEGLADVLKMGYNLQLREPRQNVGEGEPLGIIQHGYSHFSVSTHVYVVELESMTGVENLSWVSIKKLAEYPMGKIDRQIAHLLQKSRRS